MAKGFTVKAKAPKPSESSQEWDYDKAKSMVKGKTIVFCLPGRGVSYTYLKNFVQLCFDLVQAGASIQISQDYSSMVNFARCKCLGANVLRGPDQIPWDGKLNYDYQLWIDSDIVFNTEKFYQLVLMDKDIASGWYCTEDGQTTSVAHWMDEEDFRGNATLSPWIVKTESPGPHHVRGRAGWLRQSTGNPRWQPIFHLRGMFQYPSRRFCLCCPGSIHPRG